MEEQVLDEQRKLINIVSNEGWNVTESELSVYESPWVDSDDPEATITITARKMFPETDSTDNQYRVN